MCKYSKDHKENTQQTQQHAFNNKAFNYKAFNYKALTAALIAITSGYATTTFADSQEVVTVEPSTVTAKQLQEPKLERANSTQAAQHSDLADMLSKQTGVNVIRHGNQTGILQVNGLAQERVRLLVDGVPITPACPNQMDPPLHYASTRQNAQVVTYKQGTPVSQSADSLGSTVNVQPKALQYSDTDDLTHTGSLGADYHAGLKRSSAYITDSLNNKNFNLTVTAETQDAKGLKSAKGDVALTGFEKTTAEMRMGFKSDSGNKYELSLGKLDTKDAGTPALGMDMIEDDATKVSFKSTINTGYGELDTQVYYHNIDHVMDNYTLRTKAPKKMRADATSKDIGGKLSYLKTHDNGYMNLGADLQQQNFETTQTMLASGSKPAMQRDLIPDASRRRIGLFFEKNSQHTKKFSSMLGLRTDVVMLNTDPIKKSMMPDMAAKAAYNNADRKQSNTHVDALISGTYDMSKNSELTVSLARNTRSPSMVEQYLWKPSKTYAQGDGFAYVGNLNLKPEVSHKLSTTFTHTTNAPKTNNVLNSHTELYLQNIDDFIQGVATADPKILKFQNTDAELVGINQTFGYAFNETLNLSTNISYVRGKNTQLNDNLYRIAPLSGSAKLTYTCEQSCPWQVSAEVVAADKQKKVAAYNQEKPTAGYAVMNLSASHQIKNWLEVGLGVNNVFDKYYTPHLAGTNLVDNQVYGGHLAAGEKLPEAGRSAYGFVKLNW